MFNRLFIKIKNLIENLKNQKSLLGASFNLLFGQAIGFIALFILDLWLIRISTKSDFGTWKQFIWLIRFIIPFFFLGLPDSYRYFSSIDKKKFKSHFYNIFSLLIILAVILQILYFTHVYNFLIVLTKNDSFTSILKYFPLLVVLSSIKLLGRIHIIYIKKTKSVIIANLGFSIIFVGSIVIAHYQSVPLLTAILVSWIFAELFRVVFYLYKSEIELIPSHWKIRLSGRNIKRYFQYGIPYFLSSTIFLMFMNVDKTLVSAFDGVKSFAVFSIAAVEVPFIPSLFIAVSQNLFPRLASLWNDSPDKAFALWFKVFKKVSLITFPLIILLLLFSKDLFEYFYTTKYIDGVPIFRVYILLLIWRSASYSILINASGNPKLSLKLNSFFLVINIILSYILLQKYGLIGVVWGTFISFSLLNISTLLIMKKLKSFFRLIFSDIKLILLILSIFISFILVR